MMKRINSEGLKKLIREHIQTVLVEQNEIKKEMKDSLDQQVDDLFMSYETDSKPTKNENVDFRSMTKSFLQNLVEAEEDKKDEKDSEVKLTSNDIDIEKFASNVVRLIDNYDSLLEVRNTLARRAINFLNDKYESSVSKEFQIVLQDQHDITIGKSKYEEQDEEYPAPPAERSGGTGGGA